MGDRCEICDRPHGFGAGEVCDAKEASSRVRDTHPHTRNDTYERWMRANADCQSHRVDWRAEALRLRALLPTADELSVLRWTGVSGGYVKRLLGALVCSHCFGRGEDGYSEGSCRRCGPDGTKETP